MDKTRESPLDFKEIQPVHPKGDLSWVFVGRTDIEAETPVLWPPDVKSWLIWKDPDAGKDWGQEEKGTTEDETAGWHYRLNAHEFGWTPEVGDGQRGLACCDSWGRKESDTTERLNWTELNWYVCYIMKSLFYYEFIYVWKIFNFFLSLKPPYLEYINGNIEYTLLSCAYMKYLINNFCYYSLFCSVALGWCLFSLTVLSKGFLITQLVRNPSAMQGTPVWFLGCK